ncbi:MAG: BrnT family toxin [Ruminococcus sp.]|nr:BrnT family toxin [Ruminococcus sp.]MBR0530511.1 BrnT family toxin [Ruminococcus sp.]
MVVISLDTLNFEWDEHKNEINKKKHGLSFETATEVFYDELAILFDDPDHSDDEERFLIIGTLKSSKICIVSHCYRDNDNVIRLISARMATKSEIRYYQEGV